MILNEKPGFCNKCGEIGYLWESVLIKKSPRICEKCIFEGFSGRKLEWTEESEKRFEITLGNIKLALEKAGLTDDEKKMCQKIFGFLTPI